MPKRKGPKAAIAAVQPMTPPAWRFSKIMGNIVADIDTPADHQAWQARVPTRPAPREPKMRDDAAAVARWRASVEMASSAIDVDPDLVDITRIHTLTKVIAHTYDRPMAPVGSYILGMAVGAARARGEEPDIAHLQREIERSLDRAPRPEEQA